MIDWPILSIMLLIPLVAAGTILTLNGKRDLVERNIRYTALYATLINLALALLLWWQFDVSSADFQFVERQDGIFGGLFSYSLGVDGISVLLVVLSAFLMPFCILASWDSITHRVRDYMVAFLVMETLMIGVFCALDLVLFYLFFEASLIPMFLIIGVWGGARRIYASFKFFLYTLLGSVLMLVAMFYMIVDAGTSDIPALMTHMFDPAVQTWLWLAFFASFAVKMPMWPVHTWLPDAHVEAPTAGSVLLAGVLLKMGGYGFIRFSLPMFPVASVELGWLIFTLSLIAIVYTSLVALAQTDMKKLIAYSSVAHMGFVTMGLLVLNPQGIEGAIFQMVSHGIVSGALFLCVGVVYDRLHTREIARYGGLANTMPHYAVFFAIFTFASIGLPGTSGFIGEFLALLGAYRFSSTVAFIAAIGVILSAAYMLWLYRRVIFGPLEKDDLRGMLDLSGRERLILAPLAGVVLLMGVNGNLFLEPMRPAVARLLDNHRAAIARQQQDAAPVQAAEAALEEDD